MAVNDKLASEQWYRLRWCIERGHYDFLTKSQKCEDFFAGQQWSDTDLNKLKLQGRPALTINKIISTVSNILGEQIYNRNETLFRPSSGAAPETAEALTKVWRQIAQSNQLTWTRSDLFCDGIIRSRGFYDVRMDFDNNMRGKIKIGLMNSKNVIIDPDAEEYDPDYWNDVFTTKWLTYQDIALLYNQEDAEYLRDRDSSMFPYAYDSIEKVRDRFSGPALQGSYYGISDKAGVRRNIRVVERQYHLLDKQKHFVDVITGDTRPVPDAWDRNRISSVLEKAGGALSVIKKQIKRVRWTVTADHVVLHDDWSPYKHFTVVPYFPHFRYGRTIGLVENLVDSQELLNKTSSQELHIVNTTANSGWKLKAGALKNMSTEELKANGAQTGLVIELDDVANAEKISPNQVPSGLDRVSYKAEEHIKTISGVSDSMQGFDREDVAAKAIAYKQQRGAQNLTKVMDNLERTDWILARNVLDLIQEFYTEERLLHITHDDISNTSETVVVNQVTPEGAIINDLTLGEYNIVVTTTPSRATMEDSQFEQALALRKEGIGIPDETIIENSRLQNRSEIVKKMQAQANSPEAQQNAALDMRMKQAEVTKTENEAQGKVAKSDLDQARTQREMVETQNAAQGDGTEQMKMQLEAERAQQQFALDKWKMEQEFALKREMAQEEIALEREKHAQEMVLRREEAAQQQELARQQHYEQRAQAETAGEEKTETQPE